MYFNRKNAEQKNWRMIKKGKHFLFGCSLVFAVGASLAIQTVHADTASESTVESGSKAKEAKPGYGGEMGTYEAPAAVAETQPATVGKAVVAENTTAKTANKEALTQLVEEVKGLDKAGKTEDSLSRLNTALEQAQNVLANAEASQDQVDAAVASLKEAVAQLAAKEEKATAVATEAKAEATEDKAETAVAETEVARPRGKRDLSSRAANRSVDGSVAEGEFAGAGVKQFQSVRYSVDGDRTTWTISVVPQHKNHQAAGLVVASDDTIQSITVVDRGPNAGRLNEDYYVEKDFGKLPAMSNHKALASHYKYIGGGVPDSLTYSVVTKGTRHNLFARFATAIVKNSLENGGMNGSSAVKNRTSDFPEVGINLSSRLAPQPGVNNTYTQTNDTITVPTIASTDTVLTGTGTPGARINIKSEGKTVNDSTVVGQNGQWSFPITIGLNSNVTGGAQLVPGSQISVSQTVGGVESAATPVNVSLGHSEIVPSSKSKQQNNLVENDRNVTLKVPHDAGAAYFQFTDADGNAREVVLKRDAVPGNWQVTNSALASVASSDQGAHYSTINLTLNKDMKAGTTARVISNMKEGSYSSLQGWQSRNVEEAPKEETPAPQPQPQPQPEPSKPITPAVDGATTAPASAPEIVNDLAGKASTPADVTVKAPAGSTVKLYNKDGVVIGEAVANDKGVATVHPTNSLPEGEITATSTPAGGTESAKSAPITVTKTPTPISNDEVTKGPYKLQMITNTTKVTLYRGDKLTLTGDAAGTALRWFGIVPETAFNVKGVEPSGGLSTNGSAAIRNSHAEAKGTVAWTQPLGDTKVVFRATGSPEPTSNQKVSIDRVITVTVLETTKKYDPVAGTKVDIANPNNVSEDEKNKIINSVKTANPSLPAGSQYSVDEKGNLTITYPDKSTDKVAAAYLVNPTTPARENVAPTVEIPYSNKAEKEVYVYGGEANSFDIKFKDDSGKIASATVNAGGNQAFKPVEGEANKINTQFGFKANVISAETPATADAPAVITYSGTPAPEGKFTQNDLDAATRGENPKGVALGWRYATATDTDGAKIENGATNASNPTDPGAFRVMLKAQTQKYDIVAPTEKVAVADPTNVTDDDLAKIKEKLQLEYSQTNDDANLADKKGTAVADKDAKIQSVTKDADGNLVVTYKDGSQDKKPLSEFVTKDTTTPARDNVAPTVEIPYSNKATKEVYVYGGEANSFDIKFKDDSGKIASATVKQGGNKAFADVAGEANTINTQYGFKANVINAETPATADAPAVITYSGTPAATDGLSKERLDAATKGENPEGLALGWRYATATDTDGAFIQNGATNASNATDPGAFRVMLKAQTQKYDIATPTEKVTVADPANVTEAELAKIKEKVQLEYSQNNDDANLADKKGTAVADKDAKIQSVTKDADGNLVVTYADGSQDKKPLSEFVNVAPTVELPYSNEAKKEIYVYTGENTDLTFKASDNTAVKDMYVRGPGGIGKDNTADYGFTTGKIENSAVTHGDGTVSGATATIKMTGVTTLKAPNHWTSFVVANDNDNAPSTTDFRALDQNPNATQTPGYVHFIVKSQTDKYDIATPAPADKVEVADPDKVTDAELDKIKEKLQLEYKKDNDDANIAKDTPVDKDGKIKSVTKDDKGNLVVTYTDGSTDTKPLSEFVTKKPTDADKNEPTPKAQTVDKGTEPKAEDSIGNLKDLP
ncbi:Rib/alpha-like domain-containing protein, partial [Streptococcus infantis]|uniref:Rib/alpha-like domain-containing protein n=2 Tax=Streptococcus infantis TaxID=68892 RepID=UPI0039C20668